MTKEDVLALISQCAEKLGHAPNLTELTEAGNVKRQHIRRLFGSYKRALVACNLERGGPGHQLSMEELFLDWARVVRQMNKLPSLAEYELMSKYSQGPLTRRYRSWMRVPHGLKQFAEKQGLAEEWKDVMEIVSNSISPGEGRGRTLGSISGSATALRVPLNTPIYGPLVQSPGLAHGPVNEMGVVFLFGTLAERLGFVVHRVQTEFPDCEAMRNIGDERWQRVRIEFEYESRNFLRHMHEESECDLIICWRHNWPECPLEVLELKTAMSFQ
jgi:Homing endonuclease associated repeat